LAQIYITIFFNNPMKPLKIKNLLLKNPLILAPMLEITNLPYRILCRKAGASLAYTEMIYTNQLLHENKKMLSRKKEDSPLGIQITGSSVEEFKKILPFLKNYDLIDVNCGCPATKIIGTKAGAYLLREPKKIAEIIKILKTTGKPVTAKIRLGFNKNNAVEIAKAIEKAGADAITVHARKSNSPYSVPADWNEIKKIKAVLKIPVIGNGDIFTPQDAKKMLEICDGAMIGRAAIGDPLIFKRSLEYLEKRKTTIPQFEENLKQFQDYLKLCKKYEVINLQQIKQLGSHFIKGFKGASKKRDEFMKLKSLKDIEEFVQKLLNINFPK